MPNKIEVTMALKGLGIVLDGFKKLEGTLAGVNKVFAGLGVAVSAAGFVAAAKHAVNIADEMGKLAQKTGMASDEMSKWAYVARLSDTDSTTLMRALKEVSTHLVETGRGAENLTDYLMTASDEFARMPDGATKTALAVQKFGKAGQELIPLLNQGSRAIRAQFEEAEKLGIVVGKDFSEQAQNFNDGLTRLKAASEGVFLQLADKLLPTVNTGLERLNQLLADTEASGKAVNAIVAGFGKLGDAINLDIAYAKTFLDLLKQRVDGSEGPAGTLKSIMNLIAPATLGIEALLKTGQRLAGEQFFKPLSDAMQRIADATKGTGAKAGGAGLTEAEYKQQLKLLDLEVERAQLHNQQIALDTKNWANQDEINFALGKYIDFLETAIKARADLVGDAYTAGLVTEAEHTKEVLKFERERLDVAKRRSDIKDADTANLRGAMSAAKAGDKLKHDAALEAYRNTFSGAYGKNLDELVEATKHIGKNLADAAFALSSLSLDSFSREMANAIVLTGDFDRALRNIGVTILESIVEAMIKMAAQWVVTHVIMKGVSMAWAAFSTMMRTKDAAATVATEATKTPVLATNAGLSAGSSWGASAWIGLAAFVALMGVIAAAASGAFAEGGRPDVGKIALVGEKGPELFIPDTAGTIIPNGQSVAVASGEAATGGGSSGGSQGVTVALFDDRSAMLDHLEHSARGEKWVLDIMSRNINRFKS